MPDTRVSADPSADLPAAIPEPPGQGRLAHAPKDHPPVPRSRVGVLLLNLGTPDHHSYWPMRRYLRQFLSDRRVVDVSRLIWWPLLHLIILTKRPFSSGEAYRSIWNTDRDESPLLTITRAQTDAVRARLAELFGEQVIVDFAMRYGNPPTPDALHRLQRAGCDRIVVFPLYPQYAAPTTATANDEAFRALMTMRWQPAIRTVPAYYDHPGYTAALAGSISGHLTDRQATGEPPPDTILMSYHGVPERYLRLGDPYHCQCQKTTRLVREHLGDGVPPIETTFQSRFGREEWVKPYTVDRIADLARDGKTDIAVLAPGFAADCVETLEEINGEIREAFMEAGGQRFTYLPCLNDTPAHIDLLVDVIRRELRGWVEPAAAPETVPAPAPHAANGAG